MTSRSLVEVAGGVVEIDLGFVGAKRVGKDKMASRRRRWYGRSWWKWG